MQIALEIVQPSFDIVTPAEWLGQLPSIVEYCGRKSHKSLLRGPLRAT